jgi:hypothetical protein
MKVDEILGFAYFILGLFRCWNLVELS